MPHVLSVAFCNYLLSTFSPTSLDVEASAAQQRLAEAHSVCLAQQQEGITQDESSNAYKFNSALIQDMQEAQATPWSTGGGLRSGLVQSGSKQAPPFGASTCQCIGLANVPGTVVAQINATSTANYTFSVGSYCAAWDRGHHPDCLGTATPPSWCTDPWCFVDPCDCNSASPPVISSYFPNAKFQGNGLYYSYSTCGGQDAFTAGNHKNACVNQATQAACNLLNATCAYTLDRGCIGKDLAGANCAVPNKKNQAVMGNYTCPCVGISGRNGTVTVTSFNGSAGVLYPGAMGSSCQAWDDGTHPDCLSKNISARPSWCATPWCYVDPCECGLDVAPKVASYFPGARFQGNRIYYSYATCTTGANQGAADTYTSSGNPQACVLQQTQMACHASPNGCFWTTLNQAIGPQCVGYEFASMCMAGFSGAGATKPAALLAALVVAALLPLLRNA